MTDEARVWEGTSERLAEHLAETAVKLRAIEEIASGLKAALIVIAEQQQRTLGWLRENGIVFDGPLGRDPSNWQHVAFSLYNDICRVDNVARDALREIAVPEE